MVSVIIPTLNAEKHIQNILKSLKEQSIPSEIIVIDSSSTDNTIKIAESYGAEMIKIKREDFDHGGTRNLAVNHTRGDILIFLTQDALPYDEHYIENLIKPLEKPDIAAACGRQIPDVNARPLERFARLFNYPPIPLIKSLNDISEYGIKTFFFSNVCSAIRKKEFMELGGFPEKVIMNEDMVLSAKLILKGYKIAYVPEAKVIHSHNYTWIQQFKRYFDIGISLRDNPWILEHAKADKEGAKFLKEEIRYLFKNREYRWIPYAIGETISKYSGYKLGLSYTMIPNPLRKRLSMHSNYWKWQTK